MACCCCYYCCCGGGDDEDRVDGKQSELWRRMIGKVCCRCSVTIEHSTAPAEVERKPAGWDGMGWLVARMKQRRSSLSCSLLGGSLLLLLLLLLLQSLVLPMREREVRSSWSGQRRDTATATAAFECSLTTPNQHSAVQFSASSQPSLSTVDSRLSAVDYRVSTLEPVQAWLRRVWSPRFHTASSQRL